MEPAPPDHNQRHRLSWSSTPGPHGGVPSLPRPLSTTANHLPLPRVQHSPHNSHNHNNAHNPHNHHHNNNHNNHSSHNSHGNHSQPPYAGFTPRPAELHSAPPTPVHPSPAPHHPEPERRHHDQEPYAPMHDHYQPPPPQHHHHPVSPAQGHYSQSYPPRDPSAVKREPHEDSRRSSSTGHGQDPSAPGQHPSTPHHSLPPPPSYPDSQPRHMSYDNGHPVPAPGAYRQPSYPPPTPVTQQAQYEPQHGSYSSGSGDPYFGVYTSSIPAKKKNTRASQACDQCRQLKAKCDETKPCKTCRDKGLECRYRDPVPKATDKAQADILDGITSMQNTLVALVDRFDRMDDRLTKVEASLTGGIGRNLDRATAPAPIKNDPVDEEAKSAPVPPIVNGTTNGGHSAYYHTQSRPDPVRPAEVERQVEAQPQPPQPPQAQPEQQAQAQAQSGFQAQARPESQAQQPQGTEAPPAEYPTATLPLVNEEEGEAEPGRPVPPGEPAIPMNHTTLAGLLLEWPAIRDMTKHHVDKVGIRYITEYPISVEQSRGPLLVYGRGEDNHNSRHIREAIDTGNNAETATDDNSSDMASPSPAADFGLVGGLSPPDVVEYKGGALAFDGTPDFTEIKVWAYVESFKENILNMHPIITPKTLEGWVRQFLDTLPVAHPRTTKPQAVKPASAFASTPTPMEPTGSKRKRSPGPDDSPMSSGPARNGKPTRSIHSALVLLIFALGKICLHKDNIPDVVHATIEYGPHGSPIIRNGVLPPPSPGLGSPPCLSSQSSNQTSPMDQSGRGSHSRRPSIHGSSGHSSRPGHYSLKKNFDVIPGLEYFAYATDILGNLTGSYNNIKNVYANIFASLYQGQLGRPLESFAFIHKASHQLQVLMRPSLDKMQGFKKKNEFIVQPKYNNIALAFWTCLQLESDLIAEFPLPPSGLLSYEDDMPHPNMSLQAGFDQKVLDSYPGQLYLRTHLNSIHRMFYAPDDPNSSVSENRFQNVDLVADAVSGMNWVAPSLSFKEEDEPGTDILSARLRAKYWGAQVITYRPFVRQILQFSYSVKHNLENSGNNEPASTWSEFRSGIIAPYIPPGAKSIHEIDPAMVSLACKGIKALIESTRAFHGLGEERPIITNVFGTAHAQWGNLLVLSAAYRDPVLGKFVDEVLLRKLFLRTIQFLRQSSTATSSLRFDMIILEGLQRDLFPLPDPRANSSFSSHNSMVNSRVSASATPHMSHILLDQGHGTPPISPTTRDAYNTNT